MHTKSHPHQTQQEGASAGPTHGTLVDQPTNAALLAPGQMSRCSCPLLHCGTLDRSVNHQDANLKSCTPSFNAIPCVAHREVWSYSSLTKPEGATPWTLLQRMHGTLESQRIAWQQARNSSDLADHLRHSLTALEQATAHQVDKSCPYTIVLSKNARFITTNYAASSLLL